MKSEKGIGLVALIIVILVTLILVGITIVMALNSDWLKGSENDKQTDVEYINKEENIQNQITTEEVVNNQVPENTEQ